MTIQSILSNPNLIEELHKKAFLKMIDKKWLQDRFSFSEKSSERLISRLGLVHVQQFRIEMAKEYIDGKSTKDLAEKYSISDVAVRQFLHRHKIKIRQTRYFAKFNLYENLNTEEKAYILGFIYADGCIYKNSVCISLHKRDIDILEKIKEVFQAENPITKFKNNIRLQIVNTNLVLDLEKYGLHKRKTETISFPNIPKNLIVHFIRGYVDGDGSFGMYKSGNHKKYFFSVMAPIDFCETLRKIFQEELGIPISGKLKQRHKDSNTLVRSLEANGQNQVRKIVNWLYADANIFLDRKYQKYLDLFK